MIAPSTPPDNFTSHEVNSTAILLTWSPPEVPNGIIISYEVDYYLSDQQVRILLDNTLDYLVSGLDEYKYYMFTISAFTRIGQGPSTSTSARTDITGNNFN